MTERFTEKMIDNRINEVNTLLSTLDMPFKLKVERQTLEHRIHRFYLVGSDQDETGFHSLTYPYGQKTGEAYLTARALVEMLYAISKGSLINK